MLKFLEDQKKGYPYTLQNIAEKCGIKSIHTARKYLHDVLPSYERKGHGKGARYSENTLNSFRFLMLLIDKKALKHDQMTDVLKELDQEQINRVARGEEPLEIGIATKDKDGKISFAGTSSVASGDGAAILVEGKSAKTIKVVAGQPMLYSLKEEKQNKDDDDWVWLPVSDRIEIRVKGLLSKSQREELAVATRILKSIVEEK